MSRNTHLNTNFVSLIVGTKFSISIHVRPVFFVIVSAKLLYSTNFAHTHKEQCTLSIWNRRKMYIIVFLCTIHKSILCTYILDYNWLCRLYYLPYLLYTCKLGLIKFHGFYISKNIGYIIKFVIDFLSKYSLSCCYVFMTLKILYGRTLTLYSMNNTLTTSASNSSNWCYSPRKRASSENLMKRNLNKYTSKILNCDLKIN